MNRRIELINSFYKKYREDVRLEKSRQGQLEYFTTMHYIHKMIPNNATVLEIGAGTGRYSLTLAEEGFNVSAVELTDENFKILRRNCKGNDKIDCFQGDALNLSKFYDNSFDMTLMLGPMYHLYDKEEQLLAIKEAVRVTKPGGIIMTAFLSIHAIIHDEYLQGNLAQGIKENFTESFEVRHFVEQLFTGFYIDEFESLFKDYSVEWVATVATDGILELAQMTNKFTMTDEDFEMFKRYHLHNCEKREYIGSSSHLLHICIKK